MASNRVNIDDLSEEILREVNAFAEATIQDVEHVVKQVARQTAEELRETSPELTGDYAESWAYRRHPNRGKDFHDMVVYNKKPHYAKAHLLERPHETPNGRYTRGIPHIAPAEKKALRWLNDLLAKHLNRR